MRIPWSAGVISDAALIGRKDSCNDLYQLLHTLSYSTDFPDNTGWTEVDSGSNVDLSSGIWSFNGNGSFNANGIYKNTPIAISGRGGYVEFKARIPTVALGGECLIRSVSGLPTALTGQTGLTVASTVLRNYYAGVQANGVTIQGDIWYTIRIYVTKDGTSIYDLRHTIQDDTVYLTETEFLSLYQAVNIGEWYFNIQRRTNSAGALLQFKEYREYFGGYSVAAPYVTYVCDAGTDKYINGLDFTNLALPSGVSDTNLEFDYSFDDGTQSYSSKYSLTNLKALGSISGAKRYLRIRVYSNSNGETQVYNTVPNAETACIMIGSQESIYPNFNLSPNIGNIDGGTTVTLNFPDGGANLLTGVTFGGTAGTDLIIVNDNQATVKTPAKDAAQVDVVGSFTGYASFTITGGFTYQAGAMTPGQFTMSLKAQGNLRVLIAFTPSSSAEYYEIFRDDTKIVTILDSFSYIDSTTEGEHTYYVKAINNIGSTNSNSSTISISSGDIVFKAWTALKNQISADSILLSYVKRFKFDRQEQIFQKNYFPLVIMYPDPIIRETFISMPKRKILYLTVNVFGKIHNENGSTLEDNLLKFETMLKNAIEKDICLSGNAIGIEIDEETSIEFLDKEYGEVRFKIKILIPRYEMGVR